MKELSKDELLNWFELMVDVYEGEYGFEEIDEQAYKQIYQLIGSQNDSQKES